MSWFNSTSTIGSRLIKFFVSQGYVSSFSSCSIFPCCFSNHDFVDLQVDLTDGHARRPGLWKFNNSILSDAVFCEYILAKIYDLALCCESFASVKDWWDFFKESLRAEIINFSREKRKRLCRIV